MSLRHPGLGLQISQRVLRPGEDISVVRGVPGGIDHGVYVSKAVVNTLDEVVYMYGLSHVLALEVVGTGFEPGDSGAPVCIGAQVVGMIHQRSAKEASIVQAVPGIVIQKFIDDYEAHGEYRGSRPDQGARWGVQFSPRRHYRSDARGTPWPSPLGPPRQGLRRRCPC